MQTRERDESAQLCGLRLPISFSASRHDGESTPLARVASAERQVVFSKIRNQRFRNFDPTIRLEIVFQQRGQHAWYSKSRTVDRMDELRFARLLRPETN